MVNPSPYEANFPALFVDWANSKIARHEERLKSDTSPTGARRQEMKVDISYLKAAIERIGGDDAKGF